MAEAHQTLRESGLRGKVRLQADGGLKTGLDVIKAAIIGADSFGFGTGPMIAMGCKYLRICHLNNCATGVATQREDLINQHFVGEKERVINYFNFITEEVRYYLAQLGVSKLEHIIGQTQYLEYIEEMSSNHKAINLDDVKFIGYAFQIEMKYRAKRLGFKITEIPISFCDRILGTSKMSLDIFNEAFLGVLKMRFLK